MGWFGRCFLFLHGFFLLLLGVYFCIHVLYVRNVWVLDVYIMSGAGLGRELWGKERGGSGAKTGLVWMGMAGSFEIK